MTKTNIILLIIIILGAGYFFYDYLTCECRNQVLMPEDNNQGEVIKKEEPKEEKTQETVRGDDNIIFLDSPQANEEIESPLVVKGKAKGTWFFEGDFPVVLANWDGLIIAEGYASAQGEWMTEDFVPFEAELEFSVDTSTSNRGSLILQKDNPSGLPENDDALEITVFFK